MLATIPVREGGTIGVEGGHDILECAANASENNSASAWAPSNLPQIMGDSYPRYCRIVSALSPIEPVPLDE